MRKLRILLVTGVISCWISSISAQSSMVITENFDGNTNIFTSSPASAWKIDTNYYVSSHNSIKGIVPNMMGDSIVLTSPVYDFYSMGGAFVILKFSHICKVSPMDVVRIEYKRKGERWQSIPMASYWGKADITRYGLYGFNANSYPEWQAGDSLALPSQSWWREEIFDLRFEVGNDNEAQIRFVLKHGNTPATQISYGWLIDNIEIIAAPYELITPAIDFVAPFIKDTVYSTGPWEINAKVKSATSAQIENSILKYTAIYNGNIVANDSVLMTMRKERKYGDSLWKANIPQFIPGTEVIYSITGKDMTGNTASITSGYIIAKPNHNNYGDTSVALTSIDAPVRGETKGGVSTPVKVTIRNKGDSILTSATIHWSVNGVIQQPHSWTGNLSWDFEQQDSLGIYFPRMEGYDTIRVWVSMPNGIADIDLTDDTVTFIFYGCGGNMSGTYTVGQGGVFPDLKKALEFLYDCAPTGDITFALISGVYTENWDLTDISNLMGIYNLTITSVAADADSVILRPASGVGIRLENSDYLTIKDITVDAATSGTYAVQFTGACTNVLIRDCKLLTNPTATSNAYSIIYKGLATGIANGIFIINNLLDGGYCGFYFVGGTGYGGMTGKNIVFDSNTLSNQSSYGIYMQYVDFTSCSYNTVLSRTVNTSSYWCGIYSILNNGPVVGNRIIQRSNNITQPYGIYVQWHNSFGGKDTGLIANNEIKLNATTSAGHGIYCGGAVAEAYSKTKILHNSIYISGSGSSRGIMIADHYYNSIIIKNNNIVMESTEAYPIYIYPTYLYIYPHQNMYYGSYHINQNNLYAPKYMGYTLRDIMRARDPDWSGSTSIRPNFIDSSVNLKVIDYSLLLTQILPEVSRDIEGIYRVGGLTVKGCYHELPPYTVNASLQNISGIQFGNIFGQQDIVKVGLFNTGQTTLTDANLNWSINGVTQSTTGIPWSGSLLPGQNTAITLGTINYTQAGDNIIRVWINNIGTLQDEYLGDDTVSISTYICQSALSGSYTIGNGGIFPSWDAVLERVKDCGVGGDVAFEFLPGLYSDSIDLSDKLTLFGNYTLTLTSSTHNAADVTLKTESYGILLNNSNDVIIDAITIDATEGNNAIKFAEACTNVVIRNCVLLLDSVSIVNNKYVIYKADRGTGIAHNISITNNTIDGGYYGICFYAGTGTNLYGKHIVIDSNIIKNQSNQGLIVGYADSANVSNNRITSRVNNTYSTWGGMVLTSFNGTVINNHVFSSEISSPSGISVSYFNYYNTRDTGIIANNEIILNPTGSGSYSGISANNFDIISKILHNSIYVSGTNTSRGIHLSGDANSFVTLKNNNIIMESPQAYPIYIDLTDNLQNCDIDYNNMYAPVNVGYPGKDVSSIQLWQQTVTTDRHSVSVNPVFIDNAVDLQLSNYKGLESYPLIETPVDIEGNARTGMTAMGCYQGFDLYSANAMLTDIQGIQPGTLSGTTNTIKAVLVNMGNTVLTNATFNWSFNGTVQSQTAITWSGNLSTGEKDTIVLGTLVLPAGDYTIEAWITGLGSLQDIYAYDDTTQTSGYICSSPWNGTISIGATGTFKSWNEALSKLYICGVNGDITFAYEPGIYNESLDLTDISLLMGNYKLTLTSTTHNANDVRIVSNSVGILLSNSNNLQIEALTIDATAGNYAIQTAGSCTNVVIRDCKLLLDTTTTSNSAYVIYINGANPNYFDNIFIINNLLDGGSNGLRFNNNYIKGINIFFDSNTISNQSGYGISLYLMDFTSCSYNTILSRTTNAASSWGGIYTNYCNGDNIVGNRIIERTSITNSYGIYLERYFFYDYNRPMIGLVANNEIILRGTGTKEGINITNTTNVNSRVDILHNSIYITGTGSQRGIKATSNSAFVVKNNNLVVESSSGYPIEISGTSANDIDANNYYAPTYIGYVGSNCTSLSSWGAIVKTDVNSVSVKPNFIDSSISLQWNSYKELECIPLAKVPTDINGKSRTGITVMGCHHEYINMVNAKLTHVSQWSSITGTSDSIKVEITNTAVTNITTATVYWSFNGSTPQAYTWNGSLPIRQSAILTLGSITFVSGINMLDIWIGNLGGLQDEISADDSIHESFYSCVAAFNGNYTVGASGYFTTIEDAIAQLKLCGTSGDVIFALLPDIYTDTIDLSDVSPGAYTLTLTSSTNNASDVTIKTTGIAILLSNSHNIVIKNLTIDVINGLYGIRFYNGCSDITIRDCYIQAGSASSYGIYKGTASGIADNIVISNNIIEAGANGIYFYGGTDTNTYSTHIVIDNNTFSNQTASAIDVSYTDFTSISANKISEIPNGIVLSYSNGPVTNNKIFLKSGITIGSGISVSNYNTYNTFNAGLIANNEIRLRNTTTITSTAAIYGIKVETNTYIDIFHNSILAVGGYAYGIWTGNTGSHLIRIKNNNICIYATSSYYMAVYQPNRPPIQVYVYSAPIYLSTVPAQYDIDYNNIYSPSYVGSIAGTSVAMAAWRQQITTDLHSISIKPNFIDSSVNLVVNDYMPYLCPSYSRVTVDIDNVRRGTITVMGAYSSMYSDYNLILQNITRMEDELVRNQAVYVGVQVANAGNTINIDSAVFRWSINGITQPKSYKWRPSSPLQLGEGEEVLIDSFTVTGYDQVNIVVWAEKINEGKDSIAFDDTVSKTAAIVVLASFAPPLIADTIHTLSFDVYVKIAEGSGALYVNPVPKMNIRTLMSNGNILYDTIDMVYNNSRRLWVAHIPQQYFGSNVWYTLTISDTAGNNITITDETYIKFVSGGGTYQGEHIAVSALQGLVELGTSCIPDYVTATVVLSNVGDVDYDFSFSPLKLYMQVTQPEPFYLDTLISSGIIRASEEMNIEVTNMFPTVVAGRYDIRVWIDSVSSIIYDDTLVLDYVSGKFSLPIDEDFSNGIPLIFASNGINSYHTWDTVSQGSGADTTVLPQFGTGILAFKGSPGSMTTLSTQQLDLSRTVQPSLSFWYFHDTIPCEDYTDVRISVDGGTTYNTLFSLSKYDAVYGWKQYNMNLPAYAVNQCVILVFEAMEKSRSGNVGQYIDRIRIIARQDIAVTDVLTSELTACGLENMELKMVMTNSTDLALDYTTTPTTLTIEVKEIGQTFTHSLTSGSLGSFVSDTVTVATGVDFTKGTYTFKAYFSSVLDVDRMNDTLVTSIVINPALLVSIQPESGGNTNCLTGELVVNPTVTLYNTGNMDLSNIDIILQIDTGDNNIAVYALLKETYTNTILAGDTATYMFDNSYIVPWNARYDVRTYAYLSCDSALANNTIMITECVNTKDLRLISIDNPYEAEKDTVDNKIQVTATLNNRCDYDDFPNARITVIVENSLREQTESFTETQTVGLLATTSHTFTASYTVPDDSVYYLTVFVDSYDNYSDNDTMTTKRETAKKPIVSVKEIDKGDGFTLGQNIPNPANNRTRIDYSIPESGKVVFHVHSVSGQLLYSKTIEATSGKQSLELNTSTFAAGIYFYSIEYKGQRLVKRMIVQ